MLGSLNIDNNKIGKLQQMSQCSYINKKVIFCRDLVTLTSHDSKKLTLDKKNFQCFCSSHEGLSACQKSKWDLYGFSRYFLIRRKLTKKLAKTIYLKKSTKLRNYLLRKYQ